jgi:hypothetical protein
MRFIRLNQPDPTVKPNAQIPAVLPGLAREKCCTMKWFERIAQEPVGFCREAAIHHSPGPKAFGPGLFCQTISWSLPERATAISIPTQNPE